MEYTILGVKGWISSLVVAVILSITGTILFSLLGLTGATIGADMVVGMGLPGLLAIPVYLIAGLTLWGVVFIKLTQ